MRNLPIVKKHSRFSFRALAAILLFGLGACDLNAQSNNKVKPSEDHSSLTIEAVYTVIHNSGPSDYFFFFANTLEYSEIHSLEKVVMIDVDSTQIDITDRFSEIEVPVTQATVDEVKGLVTTNMTDSMYLNLKSYREETIFFYSNELSTLAPISSVRKFEFTFKRLDGSQVTVPMNNLTIQ